MKRRCELPKSKKMLGHFQCVEASQGNDSRMGRGCKIEQPGRQKDKALEQSAVLPGQSLWLGDEALLLHIPAQATGLHQPPGTRCQGRQRLLTPR